MVPQEYRLDHVVARLIERLEGARHSYAGNPQRAQTEFRRIAVEHLDTAASEMTGEGGEFEPAQQKDFLKQEVLQTFLPRYTRMANEMTEQEYRRFGFGIAASPVARLMTAGICFLVFLYLMRLWAWPLMVLVASFPFWPDVAAWLYRQQHARKLEELLVDMSRLQDEADG